MAYSKIIILCSGGIQFGSSPMIENKIRHDSYLGFQLGRRLPSTIQIGLLVSHWLEIEDFLVISKSALLEISFFRMGYNDALCAFSFET